MKERFKSFNANFRGDNLVAMIRKIVVNNDFTRIIKVNSIKIFIGNSRFIM